MQTTQSTSPLSPRAALQGGNPPPEDLAERSRQNLPPGANPAGQLVSSNRQGDTASPDLFTDSPAIPCFGWPSGRVPDGLLARAPRPLTVSHSAVALPSALAPRALPPSSSMSMIRPLVPSLQAAAPSAATPVPTPKGMPE